MSKLLFVLATCAMTAPVSVSLVWLGADRGGSGHSRFASGVVAKPPPLETPPPLIELPDTVAAFANTRAPVGRGETRVTAAIAAPAPAVTPTELECTEWRSMRTEAGRVQVCGPPQAADPKVGTTNGQRHLGLRLTPDPTAEARRVKEAMTYVVSPRDDE
jgi:hypothetical protein